MIENLQIAMAAINKWVYFSLNYKVVPYTKPNDDNEVIYLPEFIVVIKWTCPISHMIGKWKSATRSNDPHTYLICFYTELDSQNQKLLLEWIINNYNDERKLDY